MAENPLTEMLKDIIDLRDDALKETREEPVPETRKGWKRNKGKMARLIEKLEGETGMNIPEDDIVKRAGENGIGEEEARALITEFIRDGFLFRPRFMKNIVRIRGRSEFTPWSEDFPA